MPILSTLDYIILFPLIFLAGFIDAIAGGGGLISLPAYFSIGIPPHIALGTNKFSSFSGTVFSTARYFKAKMMELPIALTSASLALLGSWLGARTALRVSADFLNYLLIILIPLIAIFTLLKKNLGYEDSAEEIKKGLRFVLAALAGLVIGFYDGFFGPGTGTFLIIIYATLLKYDFIRANANTKVVNLASNTAALITFAFAGKIFYPVAIPAALFGIAGNLTGSKLVVLRGNKFIRQIFILALLLLLIRVAWQLFSA